MTAFIRAAATLCLAVAASSAALGQDVPVFKLTARDNGFEPALLEVPAGKRVRIEVANQGKKAIEFESKDLKQEKVIAPGVTAVITLNALKPGEYKYFDEFQQATSRGTIVAR